VIYIHSWSGGKDSTASIILAHEKQLAPGRIVMAEVMFDNKRGISGELPEHMEWVRQKAKPLFESWGFHVDILQTERDFMDNFFFSITKGDHKGKLRGFPIGGHCNINRDGKSRVLANYFRALKGQEITQYVGIAADEPKRLARLGDNKISLLERYGYTESMAYEKCKEYGLLSPIYSFTKRGGCWFCPNQCTKEFAHTKQYHPELWDELRQLSTTPNLVSYGFRYEKTFHQIDTEVDAFLQKEEYRKAQISLFDTETEEKE